MAKSIKTFLNTNVFSKLALAIICANSTTAIALPVLSVTQPDLTKFTTDNKVDNLTTINQTSALIEINWDTFNIDEGELVHFEQPTNGVAINNISDVNPSLISGMLTSTGTVFLSNLNGFIFGAHSNINTGAFLATTSSIQLNNDTLKLAGDPNSAASIQIHKDASINAGYKTPAGYLAFVSNNITIDSSEPSSALPSYPIDPNNSANNTESGLYAENGEILISNDINSSIKLSGLNINFPASSLSGASNTNINLQNANISAESVILSSSDLTSILSSVVNMPPSITAKDLIISSSIIDADTSSSPNISEAIASTLDNIQTDKLNIDNLVINYDSSNAFKLNGNIATDAETTLTIRSGDLSNGTIDGSINLESSSGNILGSSLNLILDAPTVTIGKFSQEFGGPSGLGSLSILGNTNLHGNIHTNGDIHIEGTTTITRSEADEVLTKIRSINGNITLNDKLSFSSTNSNIGNLYLRAGGSDGIDLAEVTGFNTIQMDTDTLYLNDDIYVDNTISLNNISNLDTNIIINNSIKLSAQTVDFEDFTFASSNNENKLTFSTIGNGSIRLKNSSITNNKNLFALNSIVFENHNSNSTIETNTDIFISGSFNPNNIKASTVTKENSFNINLIGATLFSNFDELNFSNISLAGNHSFEATGNLDSGNLPISNASFGLIDNVKKLNLENIKNLTFSNDIQINELGLSVTAKNIFIDKLNDTISISNDDDAEIKILGKIQSTSQDNHINSSLLIDTRNSIIEIGSISGLTNFQVIKDSTNGTDTRLQGDISVSGDIELTNLGKITSDHDINLLADGNISTKNSKIETLSNNVTLTTNSPDKKLNLGSIKSKNIFLNSNNIELNGDLHSENKLNFLSGSTTNLLLKEDITLSGEIDFLSTDNANIAITGNKNLSINASFSDSLENPKIYLAPFNNEDGVHSLSITTTDLENSIEIDLTSSDLFTMSNLEGGLSLLGNMKLDVGTENYEFNTSSYNGALNLSGVSISGSGTLTFNTGEGELSLGDIGTNNSEEQLFTALHLESTGKLNLHGELNITPAQELGFDFSNLNSVELFTDLTLGSADTLVKVDFGSAAINGTYDLSLYTLDLTLGTIGNNTALQDLTIFNQSDSPLSLTNDITVVGTVDITSTSLTLANTISNTGLNVDITTTGDLNMSKGSIIKAGSIDGTGSNDISLTSTEGNVRISELFADNDVTVRSEAGFIYSNNKDYTSNNPTTNITSINQYLFGLTDIGESVVDPIVIKSLKNGTISAESTGTIYIANLDNAKMNTTGRVIDGTAGGETATTDALTQFNLSSLNTVNLPTISSNLGLISNLTWQVDEEESIRKIKTPTSSPSIYYSRNGWRLGQK